MYFTGSGEFNRQMREHAISKGFTLNEHGMYKIIRKNSLNIQKTDKSILCENEREIFDFLDYPWKDPKWRNF